MTYSESYTIEKHAQLVFISAFLSPYDELFNIKQNFKMKKYMPLEGLRWSRDSGSALYDTPQTAVLGRAGGAIPGSLSNFILNLLALDYTYTSIWWYAWFYVCYVMLSPVFFKWINRASLKWILLFVRRQNAMLYYWNAISKIFDIYNL